MGVRIIDNNDGEACLYCSTTMVAFGPVMESEEKADEFLAFLEDMPDKKDPRQYSHKELMDKYYAFLKTYEENLIR